jgi:glycosyltransferase involved in cell wall biosynthesis
VADRVSARYPDLEILVVVDGFTRPTWDRARELDARHRGVVRLIRHPGGADRGPGASRNGGIRLTTGRYVCFLDSNDAVLPNRFQVAPTMLDADPSIDGVFERFLRVGSAPADPPVLSRDRTALREALLGPGVDWHVNTILLRRRCLRELGGFSESLRTSEDWVLWTKLALAARIVDGGPDPVAIYRRHGENTAPIFENSLLAFLEVIEWARGRELSDEMLGAVREEAWRKLLYVCDRLYRRGERGHAARLLIASATTVPSFALRRGFWRNLVHAGLTAGRG